MISLTPGVKGLFFFNFDTVVLIYRHWVIIAYSENLFNKLVRGPLGDATNQISRL